MEILIKWFDGKYPSFNLSLATKECKEPFLEIKGCSIRSSDKGEFISFPSKKLESGKYWNHVYASPEFGAVVLQNAKESQPHEAPKPERQQQQPQGSAPAKGAFDNFDDDIPF